MHARLALVTLALTAGTAAAQLDFDFAAIQASSDFTWSGTVTTAQGSNLPVVGNPTNAFELAGYQRINTTPSATQSAASGALTGLGDLHVVPDLSGKVMVGPIPFYDVDCIDVHMVASSPSFTVAPNGAYSTTITMTILSGTMIITPLIGVPSQLDLTGYVSNPNVQNGTLTKVGSKWRATQPINATFPFDYPPNSGTITMVGTLIAEWTPAPASTYCTAKTNSLGCVPAIAATGVPSYSVSAPFVVSATNVLNQKNGILFWGSTASAVPFQGALKCVASPTLRTPVQSSNGSLAGNDCTGAFAFDFGPLVAAHNDAALEPGREVFAQYWSRDPASSFSTNLTDGARFTVGP